MPRCERSMWLCPRSARAGVEPKFLPGGARSSRFAGCAGPTSWRCCDRKLPQTHRARCRRDRRDVRRWNMKKKCPECGRRVEVIHASSSDMERGSDHDQRCERFMAVTVAPGTNISIESATYSPESSLIEAEPVFLGRDRATCDHVYGDSWRPVPRLRRNDVLHRRQRNFACADQTLTMRVGESYGEYRK